MFILDDLVSVTRTLLTYKPKKGYEMTGFEANAI